MKLRKVISGGQNGADRTGLECAKEMGLETGGTAPKDYKTESGLDPSLKEFGLEESTFSTYQPRTKENVKNADVTLWFGNLGSPGYWCTLNACKTYNKLMINNPDPARLRVVANTCEVVNIAGNRESTNPNVCNMVRAAFKLLRDYVES